MLDSDNDSRWRNKVDNDISNLSERMAGVESSMINLGHGVERLNATLDRSISEQHASQKPEWKTYISGGALILGIVMMVGAGYVRDLEEVKTNVKDNSQQTFSNTIDNATFKEKFIIIEREVFKGGK